MTNIEEDFQPTRNRENQEYCQEYYPDDEYYMDISDLEFQGIEEDYCPKQNREDQEYYEWLTFYRM